MLDEILVTEEQGATVEEAVETALGRLGCTRAEAEIDILQVPEKICFGLLGRRPARVRVRLTDRGFTARKVTEKLLDLCGLGGEVEVQPRSDTIGLEIQSDQSSLIIGRHGQTLDALHYLVVALTDRVNQGPGDLLLDIDRYRERRTASLVQLVHKLASRTRRSGRPATTRPLSPEDRRTVYRILKPEEDLEVRSTGNGFERKVLISLRKG